MTTLPNETQIPVGWVGFYDAEKVVVGYSDFKNGGIARTGLSIVSADTEEALLAKFKDLGLTCTVKATELKSKK